MLELEFPEIEMWDEQREIFVSGKRTVIRVEHSLVSLAKWEAKWNKPFLKTGNKTHEESIDYIRCMTLTQNVDPNLYLRVDNQILKKVEEYISRPMTATWFSDKKKGRNKEVITAEVIYYWMITLNIPFECQKWHLNRLLTLIQVCNIKNNPSKKKRKEILRENAQLNEARRKLLNTKG